MERIRIDRRHPRLRARRRARRDELGAAPLTQPVAQHAPAGGDVDADLLDRIDALLAEIPADPSSRRPV